MGPERRTIRTGYRGSDFTEVLEGLEEGDEVLVGIVTNRN
jgi:multidrug efflux pump subunit AcrA (membrane-fusion protein)